MGVYVLAVSILHIALYSHRNHIGVGDAINANRLACAVIVYAILATPYPLALLGYHLFLMARGETTREYLQSLKFRRQDRHKPFTQGNFVKNWLAVLLRPRPPTYINFRGDYEQGDQRLGARRRREILAQAREQNSGVEMQRMKDKAQTREEPINVVPQLSIQQ